MVLVALTGGIAAGKSTVAKRLEALGAIRIDADQLARDAVEPGTSGLAQIVDRFGAGIVQADGSLDRAALGERVFSDPAALADLNAIVHPEVQRRFRERVATARAVDTEAVIVYEIPLLVETLRERQADGKPGDDTRSEWDLIVTVEAPHDDRVARMVELRGMSESAACGRIANQATEKDRRGVADVVIDASGEEAATLAQVDELWRTLTTRVSSD